MEKAEAAETVVVVVGGIVGKIIRNRKKKIIYNKIQIEFK